MHILEADEGVVGDGSWTDGFLRHGFKINLGPFSDPPQKVTNF